MSTPVTFAVESGKLYVMTGAKRGKFKRIRLVHTFSLDNHIAKLVFLRLNEQSVLSIRRRRDNQYLPHEYGLHNTFPFESATTNPVAVGVEYQYSDDPTA